MLIVTEINAVIDSQIMLYFRILDGIAVYLFRTIKKYNGGKMKSTETLMYIGELSKWAFTSFVPSIFCYTLL